MTAPVRTWLRAAGLAVFAAALALYAVFGGGWLLFAVLFFAPDLSMLGDGLKLPTDFRDTHLGRIGRAG